MLLSLIMAAAVAATPVAATSVKTNAAPQAAAAVAASDDNVKVCQTEDDTGSLFTRQTCHTKAEWRAINGTTNDAARDLLNRNRGLGRTGP